MGAKLEYLMSKLRLTSRCLCESNGEIFTGMGGPVHVGGVVRTGGRNGMRCAGEVRVVQAVVVLGTVEEVEAIIEAKARVLHVAVHVVGVEASQALWTALCGTTVRLQALVPR